MTIVTSIFVYLWRPRVARRSGRRTEAARGFRRTAPALALRFPIRGSAALTDRRWSALMDRGCPGLLDRGCLGLMDAGYSALVGTLTLWDLAPRHLEAEGAGCGLSTRRPSCRYRLSCAVEQLCRHPLESDSARQSYGADLKRAERSHGDDRRRDRQVYNRERQTGRRHVSHSHLVLTCTRLRE